MIAVTSRPAACKARIAASRPAPGPFTFTSTDFIPCSIDALAAASAAICAAKGVDLREPLKPNAPALDQAIAFPWTSVMVTIVLLKVERICATPVSMFFFTRRLRVFVLRAMFYLPPLPIIFSSLLRSCADLCVYGHSSSFFVRVPAIRGDDGYHDSSRYPSDV